MVAANHGFPRHKAGGAQVRLYLSARTPSPASESRQVPVAKRPRTKQATELTVLNAPKRSGNVAKPSKRTIYSHLRDRIYNSWHKLTVEKVRVVERVAGPAERNPQLSATAQLLIVSPVCSTVCLADPREKSLEPTTTGSSGSS